jgi:hypothetical protein
MNGFTGLGWYGPAISRARASVTPWPYPVPPSADHWRCPYPTSEDRVAPSRPELVRPAYRANEVAPARRRDSASTVAAKARTAPVIANVMPAERPRSPSPFVIIEISKAPTAA